MIQPIWGQKYARDLAAVYNSANTLFPEEQRCDADETVFYRQLQEDRNFAYFRENTICGFMSWRKSAEYAELTSLYVRREYQKTGVGGLLLAHFEEQAAGSSCLIVKVLRQAHWALAFYEKHGYQPLTAETRRLMESRGITEKGWEKILCRTFAYPEKSPSGPSLP